MPGTRIGAGGPFLRQPFTDADVVLLVDDPETRVLALDDVEELLDFEALNDAMLIEDGQEPIAAAADDIEVVDELAADPASELVEDAAAEPVVDLIEALAADDMEIEQGEETVFVLNIEDVEIVDALDAIDWDDVVDASEYVPDDSMLLPDTLTVEPLDHKFMLVTVGRMMR